MMELDSIVRSCNCSHGFINLYIFCMTSEYRREKTQTVYQTIIYLLGPGIIVFDLRLATKNFKLVAKSAVASFLQKAGTKKADNPTYLTTR